MEPRKEAAYRECRKHVLAFQATILHTKGQLDKSTGQPVTIEEAALFLIALASGWMPDYR